MQTSEAVTAPVKVRGIDISTYLVKDVARAKAFYRDTLGFELTLDYGDQGGEFTFDDGTTFGLWKMDDGTWSKCDGVMFAVDDVPKAVEYYRGRGVEIGEYLHEGENCTMAFGTDPEGNSFILHARKSGR